MAEINPKAVIIGWEKRLSIEPKYAVCCDRDQMGVNMTLKEYSLV